MVSRSLKKGINARSRYYVSSRRAILSDDLVLYVMLQKRILCCGVVAIMMVCSSMAFYSLLVLVTNCPVCLMSIIRDSLVAFLRCDNSTSIFLRTTISVNLVDCCRRINIYFYNFRLISLQIID